ncbi:hypothetical protein GCM10009081_32920 [Brevundimonas nasdae]
MAGATLNGSADRAAGRSAWLSAASAMALWAIIAALARFIDRVSISCACSAPGKAAMAGSGAGSGAAGTGSSIGAGFDALGGRGLADVGRPAFLGARAAGSVGVCGDLAMDALRVSCQRFTVVALPPKAMMA